MPNINRRRFTAGALLTAAASGTVRAAAEPVLQTTSGPLRGYVDDGIQVFKGVPYGATTGGANRFKPALPPVPWTDVRDALEFGPDAAQPAGTLGATGSTREDCLVANVWTPGLRDGGQRPIMVWLHGGGFSSLSGSSPMYDGTRLASQGDVVVVTLNHRLNVFGFLHLKDIAGAEFATAGNEGMLDLVHALKWVRHNARHFGGDPNNVTVFGESGGGRKVSTLMGMPGAHGLFHRAIIQSGPGIHLQPADKATEVALALLEHLKIKPGDARSVQSLPVEPILEAYTVVAGRFDSQARQKGLFEQRGFVPTVGVPELPAYAFDPEASRYSRDVPLLIGTNRHELALFTRGDAAVYEQTMSDDELARRVAVMVSDQAPRVLDAYTRAYPDASPAERWVLMLSDRTYRFDSITLAQRKARQGPATYMYYFTLQNVQDPKLLAHHALEIPFAFNNLDKSPWTGTTPVERRLATRMSDAWISFARTGRPASPALPEWPAYTVPDRSTMVFGERCVVQQDPDRAVRQLWATV